MVKSKKMSKTSIAVIVLALLLVLSLVMGITGAWFTDKDSKTGAAETSLVFGQFGDVTVALTGSAAAVDANNVAVSRGFLLPGDEVTAQGLSIKFDKKDADSDANAWYLIVDTTDSDAEYYIDNSTHRLVALANKAAYTAAEANVSLADGVAKTVEASAVYVTYGADAAAKEANKQIVTTENAENITNSYQDGTIMDLTVGFVQGGHTYEVRLIQKTNLSVGDAYDLLHAGTLIVAQA